MVYLFCDDLEHAVTACAILVKSEKTSYVILREGNRYKVEANSANHRSSDVVMHVHYENEDSESNYWC